jgi:spore germination protein YaaH
MSLSDAEALATGSAVAVRVESADGEILGTLAGTATLTAPLARGASVTFTYVAPDVTEPAVRWEQTVHGTELTVAQPWRTPATDAGGIVLVWQDLGTTADYLEQLDAAPGVTVVSPVWWVVAPDGSILDRSDPVYVEEVHERDVEIWPAVASLDADANHALLGDPAVRLAAAAQIADRALSLGADGVNIDIEGYRDGDAPGFVSFVSELAERVHAWGGTVSYDVIPRTDSWDVSPPELSFWSSAPPRREMAALVDFTVLMAYDQHNRYRPAGPVAAPAWVEDSLTYLLRFADPHRVVLGIPFYGRIWDPADLEKPSARGVGTISRLAAGGTAVYDRDFGLDMVTLGDGRFLWLEDAALLRDRLTLVGRYGLAGWAAWRLGFDSPALWEQLLGP